MFVRRLAFVLVLICMHSTWVAVSTANEMEMRKVPVAKGTASHPVNGGRCLISDGEYQYIAFYDGDHQMTVGKRKLSETEWDFVKLPERVGWDTHNRVVLFQDRKGYLHITGNMQQETDSPNRDRKPDKPRESTMIYVVEVRNKG